MFLSKKTNHKFHALPRISKFMTLNKRCILTWRHGVTTKTSTKKLKHTGNLIRKNLQLIGDC